ncbi:MAG: hypothetical protein JWN14_3015 [Chthonomonadales bacterium]|nr:hypothetical protein [Chthonomonadales bacterium]
MNTLHRFLGAAALFIMMLTLTSGQAMAQKRGSGTDVPTPLVFDYVATVNGKVPTWSGDFTMGAPTLIFYSRITNLSFSIRGKNLNMPDGSQLFVNLFTSDIATGTQSDTNVSRWHCMSAMQVTGKLGIVKAYNDFIDDPSSTIVRRLDRVVITDAAGNVLATAHP